MRRMKLVVPLVLALLAALVVLAVVQVRPPSWWTAPKEATAEDERIGQQLEQGSISELQRVRPNSEPWAIRIHQSDVNAWLAARLPKWCEHAGITGIGDVQVHFERGTIEIAAMLPDFPSVVVAAIPLEVVDGGLRSRSSRVSLGRLPLPFITETILGAVAASLAGSEASAAVTALAPLLRGGDVPAEFALVDGRRVRVRDIEIRDGELLLELETLPRLPLRN